MATSLQIAANRQNASKSTGPRTPEGKARVSFNALRHGLLSGEVTLFNEDEADFQKLGRRLHADLQPLGEFETFLVDRIISSAWRLRRIVAIETRIFHNHGSLYPSSHQSAQPDIGLAFTRSVKETDVFSRLSRYEITIERGMFKALHELQRLQAARARNPFQYPMAVDVEVGGPEEAPSDALAQGEHPRQTG